MGRIVKSSSFLININIMNRFLVFVLFALFSSSINAQVIMDDGTWTNKLVQLGKSTQLDTCLMECIYYYQVIDHERQDMREYNAILEVGDSICKYESYGQYRLDSALVQKKQVTNGEWMKLYNTYRPDFKEFIIENTNANQLSYYDKVAIDNFTYKEMMPQMDWDLQDSTKEVCGYLCHLATCSFRGRQWIAWYSDIPKGVGPWKLNGLPGLILEAQTVDKEHKFMAITVRKTNGNITCADVRNYFNTTRERFNKALADYKSDPMKAWKNSNLTPKAMNGNSQALPKKKLFYNPLEKE